MLLTHGDSVLTLAPCLKEVARSGGLTAAVQHCRDKVYGVQFHPEAELTTNGQQMFRNFLYQVSEFAESAQLSSLINCYRLLVVMETAQLRVERRNAWNIFVTRLAILLFW